VPKLQSKRGLAHHDAAVDDEGGLRQRHCEGIGDHFMCAQTDEFDKTSLDEFAHKIAADVKVTRKNSAHFSLMAIQARLSSQISVAF